MQKFCGFTDWLNSVSVTGTAALSSPVTGKRPGNETIVNKKTSQSSFYIFSIHLQPRTDLFDSLLVFNEQLNTWDVDVQPRPLGGALHRGVYSSIVFAANK